MFSWGLILPIGYLHGQTSLKLPHRRDGYVIMYTAAVPIHCGRGCWRHA